MENLFLTSTLRQLHEHFELAGYMRNQIIEFLETQKEFKMLYGMGSSFSFLYNGIEHRLELDIYKYNYVLDKDREFKTLNGVLKAL